MQTSPVTRLTWFVTRREWLTPALVTFVALLLRVWNLGHPHSLVFDETYYVKDSWTLLNLGYESKWPDKPNPDFEAGKVDGYTKEGSYVVHPPLGKWMIALGLAAFGGGSSWGWRIGTALVGTALVLVVYLIARRLTGSVAWAAVASGLLAIDGVGIVLSRVALLDISLTLFILLGFWFFLLDREHLRSDILRAVATGGDRGIVYGPVLWQRPWVFAAGLALGAATAVKWSGMYALAGLGLALVFSDAMLRRRYGVERWGLAAVLRQGPASFVLLVFPALGAYLLSWTGWLVTAGGYGRQGDANPFVALWKYHQSMYNFHVGLTSAHNYASPAWQWPILQRPTSMFWRNDDGIVQAITSIPNPLIWWGSMIAVLVLLVWFIRRPGWTTGFVLLGIAVTYGPWLLYPDRTIFQFYTIAMMPFLVIALALVLRKMWTHSPQSRIVVMVYLALALAASMFWYPLWTAIPVPQWFWSLHQWLTSWV